MINKLLNLLKMIPYDKLYHLFLGYCISDFVIHLFHTLNITNLYVSYLIPILIIAIIAGLKELYDKLTNKGTPEFSDWYTTVIGSLLNIIIVMI